MTAHEMSNGFISDPLVMSRMQPKWLMSELSLFLILVNSPSVSVYL